MTVRLLAAACFCAVVVFCVVQDRITAAAVGQYVALQHDAQKGQRTSSLITIDQVMRPAIRRSVRHGAMWGSLTFVVGAALAAFVGRAQRRSNRRTLP